MKSVYILQPSPHPARRNALQAIQTAPDGHIVTIAEPGRSLEQNAAMWPILEAFAAQVEWQVNGKSCRLDAEDWKCLLSAAFKRELARIAPGLDGGMVLLGARTSKMGKREFSDFLEFLHAEAASRGVVVYPEEEHA